MVNKISRRTWTTFLAISFLFSFYIGIERSYLFVIFLIVISLLFFYLERLNRVRMDREKYLNLILIRKITSIDALSLVVRKTKKKVTEDVEKLISQNYLKGRSIDFTTNEIVFTRDLETLNKQLEILNFEHEQKTKDVFVSVRCHSCGATNKIKKDEGGNCKFCHTFLVG